MNIKRIKVSLQHKYPDKEVEIEVSPYFFSLENLLASC